MDRERKKRKSALNQVIRFYGASLEVMAKETGIPRNTIENYTSEVRTSIKSAKAVNAQKIADYLHIDLHYLLEDEDWPLKNYFSGEILKLQNMLKPKRKKRKRKNPEYNEKMAAQYEFCDKLSSASLNELVELLKVKESDDLIKNWVTFADELQEGKSMLTNEQVDSTTKMIKGLIRGYEESITPDLGLFIEDGNVIIFEAKTTNEPRYNTISEYYDWMMRLKEPGENGDRDESPDDKGK